MLVVKKGFVTRIMRKAAVSDCLDRHHAHLITEQTTVMEAVASDTRTKERE